MRTALSREVYVGSNGVRNVLNWVQGVLPCLPILEGEVSSRLRIPEFFKPSPYGFVNFGFCSNEIYLESVAEGWSSLHPRDDVVERIIPLGLAHPIPVIGQGAELSIKVAIFDPTRAVRWNGKWNANPESQNTKRRSGWSYCPPPLKPTHVVILPLPSAGVHEYIVPRKHRSRDGILDERVHRPVSARMKTIDVTCDTSSKADLGACTCVCVRDDNVAGEPLKQVRNSSWGPLLGKFPRLRFGVRVSVKLRG